MGNGVRDMDIRSALRKGALKSFIDDPQTRVIEELGIHQGAFRIDIAAVNGALHGYEIKSEIDDLSRLPAQAKAYNTVFSFLTLIVHENHLDAALELSEIARWGVLLVKKESTRRSVRLLTVRESIQNGHVDPTAVSMLLWRDEMLGLLEERGADCGVRSKPRRELARVLSNVLFDCWRVAQSAMY